MFIRNKYHHQSLDEGTCVRRVWVVGGQYNR